jgi:heme O synthase-like polyprenyltransferase
MRMFLTSIMYLLMLFICMLISRQYVDFSETVLVAL